MILLNYEHINKQGLKSITEFIDQEKKSVTLFDEEQRKVERQVFREGQLIRKYITEYVNDNKKIIYSINSQSKIDTKTEVFYDRNGYELCSCDFDNENHLLSKNDQNYDKSTQNNQPTDEQKEKDDSVKIKYNFDRSENLIQVTALDSFEIPIDYECFEYDESNNCVLREKYIGENNPPERTEFEYDGSKKVKSLRSRFSQGEKHYKFTFFEYHENDQLKSKSVKSFDFNNISDLALIDKIDLAIAALRNEDFNAFKSLGFPHSIFSYSKNKEYDRNRNMLVSHYSIYRPDFSENHRTLWRSIEQTFDDKNRIQTYESVDTHTDFDYGVYNTYKYYENEKGLLIAENCYCDGELRFHTNYYYQGSRLIKKVREGDHETIETKYDFKGNVISEIKVDADLPELNKSTSYQYEYYDI